MEELTGLEHIEIEIGKLKEKKFFSPSLKNIEKLKFLMEITKKQGEELILETDTDFDSCDDYPTLDARLSMKIEANGITYIDNYEYYDANKWNRVEYEHTNSKFSDIADEFCHEISEYIDNFNSIYVGNVVVTDDDGSKYTYRGVTIKIRDRIISSESGDDRLNDIGHLNSSWNSEYNETDDKLFFCDFVRECLENDTDMSDTKKENIEALLMF